MWSKCVKEIDTRENILKNQFYLFLFIFCFILKTRFLEEKTNRKCSFLLVIKYCKLNLN